jgi:hypothetical protein
VIPALSGDATDQTPPDLPSYLFKERIVYLVSAQAAAARDSMAGRARRQAAPHTVLTPGFSARQAVKKLAACRSCAEQRWMHSPCTFHLPHSPSLPPLWSCLGPLAPLQGMSLVPAVTELVLAEMLYLQYDNPTRPIFMYINSTGVVVS